MDLANEKLYAALVPIECRADLHHYLAERTDLSMPLDGCALILNNDQVLKVIEVAYGTEWKDPVAPKNSAELRGSLRA
jgi:hypothetical protein